MEGPRGLELIFKSAQRASLPAAFSRFLLVWFASLTADGMRFAAIPLLALATHPSPAAVSAVATAMALPWLLVSLPAGLVVDRFDPAKVIATANLTRALAACLLVLAIVAGAVGIPWLCAVGFVLTAAETFADSAAQSLLVRMVPSGQLEQANARLVSSDNVGLDLIGPLLAGSMFLVGRWLPFAVAGSAFAATAVLMLTLTGHGVQLVTSSPPVAGTQATPIGPLGPAAAVAVAPSAGGRSVSAGFLSIFADPGLRILVLTVAVMAGAIAAVEGVLVVYSTSSLHLSEALYPTLLASYSLGLLSTAAAIGRWGIRLRSGPLMVGAIGTIGVALIGLGLVHSPAPAWCSFAVMGGAAGTWNVLSATRRQRRTPPHMLAQVSSTFRAIGWGALPLGTAVGGIVGERWSVPTVFLIAGAAVLTLGVLVGPFFLRHQAPTG